MTYRHQRLALLFTLIAFTTGCIKTLAPKTHTWSEQYADLTLTQSGCSVSEIKLTNNSGKHLSNSNHVILAVNEKTKATHETYHFSCSAVIPGGHSYCTTYGGDPNYIDMGGLGCPDLTFLKESSFFFNY